MFNKNIHQELNEIKKALREISMNFVEIGGWISAKTVQKFFNYSESNMAVFEKKHNLTTKKINRRKFYRKEEIIQLLNSNKNQ
jgi:hypothetical protein